MRKIDSCPHRSDVREAVGPGAHTHEMALCAFIAQGMVVSHRLARGLCEACVAHAGLPNPFIEESRQLICRGRVVEAHIPDGPDNPYRISVDEAAAGVGDEKKLARAIILGIERGQLATAKACALADRHCALHRDETLLEIADAALEAGEDPASLAPLLESYGIRSI